MSAPDDFARFQRIEKLIVDFIKGEGAPIDHFEGTWKIDVADDVDLGGGHHSSVAVSISGLARLIAEDGR